MTITPSIKKDYLVKLANSGKRADGRGFDEYKKIDDHSFMKEYPKNHST